MIDSYLECLLFFSPGSNKSNNNGDPEGNRYTKVNGESAEMTDTATAGKILDH